MKCLLLSALLLVGLATHGQEWAGGLPTDSVSGKITFRGSESMPGTPAAVLRKRANLYAGRLAVVDSSNAITLRVFSYEHPNGAQYRITIEVANGSYHYKLSDFEYFERGEEGFLGGKIASKEPDRNVAAEERLQDVRGGYARYFPTLRKQIAETAELGIRRLKIAMQ